MKAAAALCLALAGCGTIQDLSHDRFAAANFGPSSPPRVFGGLRMDAFMAGQGHSLGWFHYLDVPFSLPLDVVLLPVSIPVALLSKDDE
jgi:uncharacterized protein YceK